MSFRATIQALKWGFGLVLVFLAAVLAGAGYWPLAVGFVALALVFAIAACTLHGYITPQCTATVFRDPNGYVTRIVTEGQRVLYSTIWEHPAEVIDTRIKSTEDRYNGFRTKDNVPVDIRVKISYRHDPRLVPGAELPQFVAMTEEMRAARVRTIVRGTVLAEIGQRLSKHVIPLTYRNALCAALSQAAAAELVRFGAIISQTFGVSIQDIQPANAMLEAMVNEHAALLKGQAAADVLLPIVSQYGQDGVLEAAIAATILNTGSVPSVIQEDVDRSPVPMVRPRKPAA